MHNPSGHRLDEVFERIRAPSVVSETYPEPLTKTHSTPFKKDFAHSSTFVTVTHFLKSLFGMTIMAVPGGFCHGGMIFSAFGFVSLFLLVAYNMKRLIISAAHLSEREKIPVRTYDEVAYVSFDTCSERTKRHATSFKVYVNVLFFVTYVDACIIFMVFVARAFEAFLVQQFPNSFLTLHEILFLQVLLLMGMTTLRDLKYLAPFSFVGCAFFLCAFTLTLVIIFRMGIPSPLQYPYIGSLKTNFLFLSIALYSLSGISIALTIKSSMKHPQHFFRHGGVYNLSLAAVCVAFLFYGVFAYAKFGKDTRTNLLLSLPGDGLSLTALILGVMSVFFSYPINFYVAFNVIWFNYLKPQIKSQNFFYVENFSRYCLVIICFLLAMAFSNLSWMIPLKGAMFHSHLEVIIPAVLDYVTFYPERGSGKYHCRQVKAILIISVGTIVFIGGTIASLSLVYTEYTK